MKNDVHHTHGRKLRKTSGKDSKLPETPLKAGWSMLELSGGYLLIISLIIGPLLAGSYYGWWRWPLITTSTIAAVLLIISSTHKRRSHLWLIPLLLWPIIQGLWMWYNAWGEFTITPPATDAGQPSWRIFELAKQPFSSLPGTVDKGEAMDRLTYIIPCLGLIWGTRHLIISRPTWCHIIAVTIFWAAATVALIGLIQRASGAEAIFGLRDMYQLERGLFFGTYRSPGIATCYLNLGLAFGLSSLLTRLRQDHQHDSNDGGRKNKRKILQLLLTIAGIILIICAVTTAGSKTGMILGISTIILWAIINRRSILSTFHKSSDLFDGNKRMERNVALFALLCITLLSLLCFAGVMSDRWLEAHEQGYSSLTGRIHANQVQINMIGNDHWGTMGYGPGSFYPLFPYYAGEHSAYLKGIWVYAHNDYLQTLVEWGWLGTACFIITIGGGFIMLLREVFFHREDHSKTRFIYFRGYLLAMLTMLLHAIIDFPFQIESIAITFSIMLGVAWAVVDLRGREIRTRTRRSLT